MADNQEFYRLKLVLSMQDRLTARLKKIDESVLNFEERMAKTQAGCNEVIAKPYPLEKLKETIETYL